uniref:Uncharacterized protein n=1 Tax=Serinus canaria TaxID=9135 RepID=A0A8C9L228_SERCA
MAGGDGHGWPCGMWSPSYSPVLMTFWMALATCPLSRELRSLTRRMRQVQSTTRDPASSTSPTARSGSGVSVKRCSPAPQHGWTRGWGWPGPAHKPAPTDSPTPGPQHNISQPCPTFQHFSITHTTPSPTCTSPAPCPVPQPCPSPPHPLTLLPGDVVKDLNALSAAVAGGCAVCGGAKPHSGHLQGEGGLQLAPQCPLPVLAHHPSLWECLVAPAGPRAPHLWGCRSTPDADEAPVAQALVPCRDARDHRLVQLQQHTCWRGHPGANSTHRLGTSSLAWGHHCQPGNTWIQ